MTPRLALLSLALTPALFAQVSSLPTVTIYSPSIANQSPAAAFAMPVSALRYEPLVDLETRNLPEAQSDITIRGNIFENTGIKIGSSSLFDPQTGHYLGELPIAPEMLGAPTILTGTDHAIETMNSTVGAVAYGWRPISGNGAVSAAVGNDGLLREEVYDGSAAREGSGILAADADWSHADGNGTVDFGDFDFNRVNGRIQYRTNFSQTDLFAGYQTSFLGWPNLYTPFNSDETDSLQTILLLANHHQNLGNGQFLELGAFWRRNKDDYAFNRFAPLGPTHPFQHTTWIEGVSGGGLFDIGPLLLDVHAEATADDIKSTSLIFGPFHRRDLEKVAVVPEYVIPAAGGSWIAKAGATEDRSSRDPSALSPIADLSRTWTGAGLQRLYASYAVTTQLPSYTALKSSPTAGLFFGNQNLGRETSRNDELGGEGTLDGWTLHAAGFYRRDENLVDWTYLNGVFGRTANAVSISTYGAEITARHSWTYVDLVLGYTYLTKNPDYQGALVTASFYALNYARDRATLALTIHLTQDVELRSDSEARIQEADALRVGSNDAFMERLGIHYHPSEYRGWDFSVQVDNLSGSSFQEIPAVPAPGRQFSFSVGYAW